MSKVITWQEFEWWRSRHPIQKSQIWLMVNKVMNTTHNYHNNHENILTLHLQVTSNLPRHIVLIHTLGYEKKCRKNLRMPWPRPWKERRIYSINKHLWIDHISHNKHQDWSNGTWNMAIFTSIEGGAADTPFPNILADLFSNSDVIKTVTS